MRKNSYKIFRLASLAFYVLLFYIFHTTAFLIKNHGGNPVHVVTSQELEIVCGESDEKNGKKMV